MQLLDKMLGNNAEDIEQVIEIPILCRVWEEDGVWNGEAVHISVAVFGHSFEETKRNLIDAVFSHLEALQETGKLKETIDLLRLCARQKRVSIDEMPLNSAFWRLGAGLQDKHIVSLA